MRKRSQISALATLLFAALVLLVWPERVWTLVAGTPDLGAVDFSALEKPRSPNAYLACPETVCQPGQPDIASPKFDLAAGALRELAVTVWRKEPGVTLVDEDPAAMTARFVQRSRFLKFPDTVSVQFFAEGESTSTLAVYSRSQLGYSDLGANEKRVKQWLAMLDEAYKGLK